MGEPESSESLPPCHSPSAPAQTNHINSVDPFWVFSTRGGYSVTPHDTSRDTSQEDAALSRSLLPLARALGISLPGYTPAPNSPASQYVPPSSVTPPSTPDVDRPEPKTPEQKPLVVVADSPLTDKHVATPQGKLGELYQARVENLKDVGRWVQLITVDEFFGALLPQVKGVELLTAAIILRRALINLGKFDQDGCWRTFGASPADQTAYESVVFEPFADLVEDIVKVCCRHRTLKRKQARFSYVKNPNNTPQFIYERNTSKPDGYLIDANAPTEVKLDPRKVWWRDIALGCEVKKKDSASNRLDNIHKLIWSFKQILHEDPCRRFALGFTVENRAMRLWHCDRARVLVSEPFDFISEPMPLIHLFLAFLYSDKAGLGWDPTAQVFASSLDPNTPLEYEFRVDNRIYRTEGAPTYDAAYALLGRCTRVWDVREVLAGGILSQDTAVLKDTWTEATRRREGGNYDIFKSLELPKDERYILDHLLLTKICHADVYINGELDATREVDLTTVRKYNLVPELPAASDPRHDSEVTLAAYRDQLVAALPEPISRGQLVHNRIVFRESGTALRRVQSLGTVMKALGDVALGLLVLHKYGWVHRDISAANILVCPGNIVKLIDFEYAKHESDQVTHHGRTGTRYYMPVEVRKQHYWFLPPRDDTSSAETRQEDAPAHDHDVGMRDVNAKMDEAAVARDNVKTDKAQDTRLANALASLRKKPSTDVAARSKHYDLDEKPRVFVHNPIHDLESLQWIGRFFVCERKVVQVGDQKCPLAHDKLGKQLEYARKIFPNNAEEDERPASIATDGHWRLQVQNLHPAVQKVGYYLEDIRRALVRQYRVAEANLDTFNFKTDVDWKLYTSFFPHHYGLDLEGPNDILLDDVDPRDISAE